MMRLNKTFRPGAKAALLDEYEKVLRDLRAVIDDISEKELCLPLHQKADDPDSASLQAILTHIVKSGYAYAVYIGRLKDSSISALKARIHKDVIGYQQDLSTFFIFTQVILQDVSDAEIDQFDEGKSIITSWGQTYNIEQMLEHAIVHILRHRRQIEHLKLTIRS